MPIKSGIYVDDSGTPGSNSGSIHLPDTRKSWTAVLVPPSASAGASEVMEIFLDGIERDYGAKELHFTEIFSGKGVWKSVRIENRIEMFRLMSAYLSSTGLPIVHVTTSQGTLNDHPSLVENIIFDAKQFWNMSIPKFGFLRCCMEISDYFREMREDGHPDFNSPLPMFADEGLAVAGAEIPLPNWGDVVEGPSVRFARSQDVPGIQLADFAAFTVSRTQWIIAKKSSGTPLSRSDEEFLSYGEGLNIVNLPMVSVEKSLLSKEYLEELLEKDRITKGLPPKPSSLGEIS